ncbi:hypothetical protein RHS01_04353 [Rhizoctonia solani]|uniref:Extracellular membrane protein CFEM domain-containing protein n=1 Tax=Rhizoctonia solani TaxID=456999 RepID=A0A8H7IFV4_9AGAM|nr:hypothetical protein RHS01_04353 [Rhizoctonia solani]
MKSVFAFAALFAAYAAAQTTTSSATPPVSTGDISPCVLTCSTQAATSAGCTGITDSQCPDEVASATALQSQLCGAAGSGSSTAPTASETETEVSGTVSSSGTASVPATGTATTPAGTTLIPQPALLLLPRAPGPLPRAPLAPQLAQPIPPALRSILPPLVPGLLLLSEVLSLPSLLSKKTFDWNQDLCLMYDFFVFTCILSCTAM